MKTSEEIREEVATREGCASWFNLIATEDMSISEKILEVDRCMKIYAKQVAEQALVDASENAEVDGYQYGDDSVSWIDKNSIINTPIQLP